MWPGRSRSCGVVAGSIAASTVAARSAAEIPVLVLPRASTGTHIAVSRTAELTGTVERDLQRVEPLRRHRQADQAAAVRHHEVDDVRRDLLGRNRQVAFVLPILVVDDDHEPAVANGGDRRLRRARTGCDAGARCGARRGATYGNVRLSSWAWNRGLSDGAHGARDVFADHVAFEIDARSGSGAAQVRVRPGVRNDLHLERIVGQRRDRQADAIHRDRALGHEQRREVLRRSGPLPTRSRRPAARRRRCRCRRRGRARSARRSVSRRASRVRG